MGGVVFIFATLIAYIAGHLVADDPAARTAPPDRPDRDRVVLLGLFVFCGVLGFLDDYLKVAQAQQRRAQQARQAHRTGADRCHLRRDRPVRAGGQDR